MVKYLFLVRNLKTIQWTALPKAHKVGDVIEGEVVRFVPYGVFVRVFNDINGLVHLSELSQRSIQNPNEVVKLGQIVQAKIILLDPRNKKDRIEYEGLLEGDEAPVEEKKTTTKSTTKQAQLQKGKLQHLKLEGLEMYLKNLKKMKIL